MFWYLKIGCHNLYSIGLFAGSRYVNFIIDSFSHTGKLGSKKNYLTSRTFISVGSYGTRSRGRLMHSHMAIQWHFLISTIWTLATSVLFTNPNTFASWFRTVSVIVRWRFWGVILICVFPVFFWTIYLFVLNTKSSFKLPVRTVVSLMSF